MCMHAHMHACAYVDKDLFCNSPWAVLPVYIHIQVIHNIQTTSLGKGNLRCLKKALFFVCLSVDGLPPEDGTLWRAPQITIQNPCLDSSMRGCKVHFRPTCAWIFLSRRYLQIPGRPQLSLAPRGKIEGKASITSMKNELPKRRPFHLPAVLVFKTEL